MTRCLTTIANGIRTLVTNDFEWRRRLDGLPLDGAGAIRVVTLAMFIDS